MESISVGDAVRKNLARVERLKDVPSTNATLVQVSHERGSIGESPKIWGIATESLGLSGSNHEPTKSEIAVATALRLAYMHRKKSRRSVMGKLRPGQAFGSLRNLSDTTLDNRLKAICRTHNLDELEHHVSALVSMMTGGGSSKFISLDYGQLAEDLLAWQNPSRRAEVTARWARDTYTQSNKKESKESK